jgi:hypothetical protein
MSDWESSKVKYSNDEIRIGHFADKHLGKYYKNIGANMALNFNLYNYILHNLDKSDAFLAKAITNKHKTVFTVAEIKAIKAKMKNQASGPYPKSLLKAQKGGGLQPGSPVKEEGDESRNGFWDKLIRKISTPITRMIPEKGIVNYALWWIQILYHLEQMDLYGPFISQALDSVTLSLPVMAEITEDMAGNLIGLAPIPYAGQAGDLIGYMLSLVFTATAVVINNSRRHFGSAFITSLDALPLIGEALSLAATNLEKGANRFAGYKKKLTTSVSKLSPAAGGIIHSYVPDVEIHNEPLPPVDLEAIQGDLEDYAKKKSGLDKVEAMVNTVSDPSKIVSAATNTAAAKVSAASNAAAAHVEAAKTEAANHLAAVKNEAANHVAATSNAVTSKVAAVKNDAANHVNAATILPKKGGRRLTRKKMRHFV